MSSPAFQAVLLAGGRSSRMGRDKALLPHPGSGRPLILHQLDTLQATGCGDVFLSVRHDQDYPLVPAAIPRVRDSGDAGPFAALEAALARTTAPLLLVLAVDLPFVAPGRLHALLALCAPERGVAPVHLPPGPGAGAFEPLCAVYPSFNEARTALASARLAGRFSLQELLAGAAAAGWMHPLPLTPADLPAFANWNTPADLRPAGG
jgi:molybdenum cofactor guanylyltransferase